MHEREALEMTKDKIYRAFDGKLSRKAIIERDGEWVIQGKWCIAAPEADGIWDLWLCHPQDMAAGLGQRKVRNTLKTLQKSILALKTSTGTAFRELTGEAWGKVAGTTLILANTAVLGIRRKRKVSQAQIDRFVQRVRK